MGAVQASKNGLYTIYMHVPNFSLETNTSQSIILPDL